VEIHNVANGDLVIAPFPYSDCIGPGCRAGITTSCVNGGFWAVGDIAGGQQPATRRCAPPWGRHIRPTDW
jgi:threonine dehydrogenase-like Zn-dependent dehydrogenase